MQENSEVIEFLAKRPERLSESGMRSNWPVKARNRGRQTLIIRLNSPRCFPGQCGQGNLKLMALKRLRRCRILTGAGRRFRKRSGPGRFRSRARQSAFDECRGRSGNQRATRFRAFLKEQYRGCCQICRKTFLQRDGEPYFTGKDAVSRTRLAGLITRVRALSMRKLLRKIPR